MNISRNDHLLSDAKSRFLAVLDRIIPHSILQDTSERFKARALVLITAIVCLLSVISMILIISVDNSVPLRRWLTIALISLQPLALGIMWYSHNASRACWYVVILLCLTVMYINFNNSSLLGPFSILWMLPTSLAAMLLSGRAAFQIALLSLIGMSINYTLLRYDLLPPAITDEHQWLKSKYIISITIILIVTFCLYVLSRMERLKEYELSKEIETRKRIAQELEEAKTLAEQAYHNKSMFLATMSHELRTPLNSIIGNSELLHQQPFDKETLARVHDIHAAGQLLLSIVNDVLDLSKLDSYGIDLHTHVYDLAEQMQRIHRMMEIKVKPGVSFTLHGVDKPLLVEADEHRVSQIVLNLVANALKFTDQGEVSLSLRKESEQSISIQVKDTGIGISEKDAAALFQDFVQIRQHKHRQLEGTGLGLAIAQRLVSRMNGKIDLVSSPGEGSCFTVHLPLSMVTPAADDVVDKSIQQEAEMDFSRLTVLIVDDVDMNCMVLKALLEAFDVSQITMKHDGEEALELIRQGELFDVIFMDMRMPKMDGLEATALIRKHGYQKAIVAITANAFDEDKQACIEAGMNSFISKPIQLEDLKNVLQDLFRSAQ